MAAWRSRAPGSPEGNSLVHLGELFSSIPLAFWNTQTSLVRVEESSVPTLAFPQKTIIRLVIGS